MVHTIQMYTIYIPWDKQILTFSRGVFLSSRAATAVAHSCRACGWWQEERAVRHAVGALETKVKAAQPNATDWLVRTQANRERESIYICPIPYHHILFVWERPYESEYLASTLPPV